MMKKAFTMIELIFVIVILGILASVAIPKLAATRDDATIVGLNERIKGVMSEIMTTALAQGGGDGNLTELSPALKGMLNSSVATLSGNKVSIKCGLQRDCIVLDINASSDIIIDVKYSNTADSLCKDLQELANISNQKLQIRGKSVVY